MIGMFSIHSWSTYPFMEIRNPFNPGLSLMNCARERARTFSSAFTLTSRAFCPCFLYISGVACISLFS